MTNLFDYVTVIPNCISPQLIELYLSLPRQTSRATTGWGEVQSTHEARVTTWITLPDEVRQSTTASIANFYNSDLINKYKQTLNFVEAPQFLHYAVGGKYDIHNDSEDYVNGRLERVVERDLTILTYLNDDYSGGELELPDWGVKFKPKAGTVIAFPAYSEFSHVVHPVTHGERMNIVSWICTNDRIYPRPY